MALEVTLQVCFFCVEKSSGCHVPRMLKHYGAFCYTERRGKAWRCPGLGLDRGFHVPALRLRSKPFPLCPAQPRKRMPAVSQRPLCLALHWLARRAGEGRRRRRRRRAQALINYLRPSGVGLPPAIWLRDGREGAAAREGGGGRAREEERRKEGAREKKGRDRARKGKPPTPLAGSPFEVGASTPGASLTAPPGGRVFLPVSSTPPPVWFMEKKKMVTQVRAALRCSAQYPSPPLPSPPCCLQGRGARERLAVFLPVAREPPPPPFNGLCKEGCCVCALECDCAAPPAHSAPWQIPVSCAVQLQLRKEPVGIDLSTSLS